MDYEAAQAMRILSRYGIEINETFNLFKELIKTLSGDGKESFSFPTPVRRYLEPTNGSQDEVYARCMFCKEKVEKVELSR